MGKRKYNFYLKDILTAINRIQEYIEGHDFDSFVANYMVSDAVVRNFENDIQLKYPELPWKQMYGLKNIVSHEYFGVDYHTLWKIAKDELPQNKADLIELLKSEGIE